MTKSFRSRLVLSVAFSATLASLLFSGCKTAPAPKPTSIEGKACAADADCGAGYHCENGVCHVNCDASNPCGAGKDCVEGHCQMNEKPAESACSTSGTIHFDFDKYDIKSGDDSTLNDLGMCLTKDPSVKIVIEGNCDERGSSEYNMALGNRRADAVKGYLTNKGVSADRIKTVSFGKENPVDKGHNEEAWAANRRADVKPQ